MSYILYILLALILFLFIPFPVFIIFEYTNGHSCVYLYKFKLNSSKKASKNKSMNNDINFVKKIKKTFSNSRLYSQICLEYGLEDAFLTGILYGIFYSIFDIIYDLFSLTFKIKKFSVKCNPIFNKSVLNFKIKSIIFINFAKVIYIILIFFSYKKHYKNFNN